jgi:hypothetical protein
MPSVALRPPNARAAEQATTATKEPGWIRAHERNNVGTSVRTLADRVDSFPDPWLHEPGDKLIGEIVELATADKGFGPYSMVTVLVSGPGSSEQGGKVIPAGCERVWHAFGTVPENELKKQTPRVGDLIAAKYFGVRDGTDYKAYRILVESAEKRSPNPTSPAADTVVDSAEAPEEGETPAEGADNEVGSADEPKDGEAPAEGDDGISY